MFHVKRNVTNGCDVMWLTRDGELAATRNSETLELANATWDRPVPTMPPQPLKTKPRAPKASHYLGGSNNLLHERKRREAAERQAKQAGVNLQTLTVDLVPKVNELAAAVEVLQLENSQQLHLEELSQDTFLNLQHQLEALRQQQLDMQVKLHKTMDAKLERAQHEIRQDHAVVVATVDNIKIEVEAMKEQMAILRGEMDSLRTAANAKLSQTQALLDSIRDQGHKDNELTTHSLQDLEFKIGDLDAKLFALEKEQLKLRLSLPPSVAARTCFDSSTTPPYTADATNTHQCSSNGGAMQHQRLEQLHLEMEAMVHDMATQRGADRLQFEAISNRMREMAKVHNHKHDVVLVELQDMHDQLTQVSTKCPVEISQRMEALRQTWEADISSLKLAAKSWAATARIPQETRGPDTTEVKELVLALQARMEIAEIKMGKLSTAVHSHHIGAGTQLVKVQKDVGRVQEHVTRSQQVVMKQLVHFHDVLAELRRVVEASN
ncbi:hypothetical protein, variant 2 [Aphanomyces invadans]|uniref:Uncharacterized protein n=2 Tax=Aphanomyces invadans TaxID=157072 RepID=A0A024U3P7_9STRA|nr:hypothetical protein, variant 2 [Aphanomyces invadans]ETW00512.1 hypothetical protein, variant 2 [Aphanomyces invadans]|eukprot:XP_008870647.1 hypothetical protein, variant 2 [Aphanomyces invadans]